jgi:uncharacterized protein with GYD domain
MAFYMFQGRYSTDSIKAMLQNPQDSEAAGRKLIKSVGGKMHSMFFTFGSEDFVVIMECPDDKTAAACSFVVGASGGFSAGATTKLLTTSEAMEAMGIAKKASAGYKPPKG